MGKKAKSLRHQKKMLEKKEKAAKAAKYAAEGQANKSAASAGQLPKVLGDHPRGPCGNHACTRSACHASMSRRWEDKKQRQRMQPHAAPPSSP